MFCFSREGQGNETIGEGGSAKMSPSATTPPVMATVSSTTRSKDGGLSTRKAIERALKKGKRREEGAYMPCLVFVFQLFLYSSHSFCILAPCYPYHSEHPWLPNQYSCPSNTKPI